MTEETVRTSGFVTSVVGAIDAAMVVSEVALPIVWELLRVYVPRFPLEVSGSVLVSWALTVGVPGSDSVRPGTIAAPETDVTVKTVAD